jgi:MFS family permease
MVVKRFDTWLASVFYFANVRSLFGFGAGGVAPIIFGVMLDLTNPVDSAPENWGWAFTVLGLGGLVATLCALLYRENALE